MEQSLFYWTQSIYAIIGIVAFILIIILAIALYKKMSRLEIKVNRLTDKALETADSTKDILKTGQKLFFYGVYEFLKNLKSKK